MGGGGCTEKGGDVAGVCVPVRDGGWRVYRVYMKHHYHIKDILGFSVLMVITLPTIGAHCSDHNKKKKNQKIDGGMRRRGIKRKCVWVGGGYNWLGLSGYVNTAHLFN